MRFEGRGFLVELGVAAYGGAEGEYSPSSTLSAVGGVEEGEPPSGGVREDGTSSLAGIGDWGGIASGE